MRIRRGPIQNSDWRDRPEVNSKLRLSCLIRVYDRNFNRFVNILDLRLRCEVRTWKRGGSGSSRNAPANTIAKVLLFRCRPYECRRQSIPGANRRQGLYSWGNRLK